MGNLSILKNLTSIDAIRYGHFVLSSGRHTDTFIGITEITLNTRFLDLLAEMLSNKLKAQRIDIVVAPALSGILIGGMLAIKLRSKFAYAEWVDGKLVFRRGFDKYIAKDSRVLVVDDVITTGRSVKAITREVSKIGGNVVGYATIWQRENIKGLDSKVYSIIQKNISSWDKVECPLCKKEISITLTVNKRGEEFLNKYGDDPKFWPANIDKGSSK